MSCIQQVEQSPLSATQTVALADWEQYISQLARHITSQQSPAVSEQYYSLLLMTSTVGTIATTISTEAC
jgi:hypothetical protein